MQLSFRGSRLRVMVRGLGRAVIWIHGFPLSSAVFREQLAIPDCTHIIPDLPGFGESEPFHAEGTIEGYADAIVEIINTMHARQPIVAGLSMGGYVAMSVARKCGSQLGGLILIDSRETADSEELRRKRLQQAARISEEGVGFLIDEMLPKMLTPLTIETNPALAARTREMMWTVSSAGAISALHAMAGRADSTNTLAQVEVPCLVVVGREDSITPVADARRMVSKLRDAELVELDGCAHLANLEGAASFNQAVGRYLARLDARSRVER